MACFYRLLDRYRTKCQISLLFPNVGTVRSDRLKGVTLKTEKELKKEGRGTSDYRVDESEKLIVVRWYNRTVDVRKFLTILVLILQIKFGDGKKKPLQV
jgi:hypothetical protein